MVFFYPTIVAITSACENANKGTQYSFYIYVEKKFFSHDSEHLKTIESAYSNCEIIIRSPSLEIEKLGKRGRNVPSYFRLFASEFFPEIDKIIYIDGDVLVLKDLNEMYNLNIENHYYLGFYDAELDDLSDLKLTNALDNNNNRPNITTFIYTGVLLMNLKKQREDNIIDKFKDFINIQEKYLVRDQLIINAVGNKKNAGFHPKYGVYNFYGAQGISNFLKRFKPGTSRNKFEHIMEAVLEPTIVHLTHAPKPWEKVFYDSWFFRKRNFFLIKINGGNMQKKLRFVIRFMKAI